MFVAYWSVKGGSGTTVVAVGHALQLARQADAPVVLVDLAGEVAAVLGVAEPSGPGVGEWLADGGGSLLDLATPVGDGLLLLHPGRLPLAGMDGEALTAALGELAVVVVDCGVPAGPGPAGAVAAGADRSLLVLRPCYLALRRAVAAPVRPSGVVLVTEPHRALGRRDVEAVLGVPVRAEIPWDPDIARAVDAGLLATRLPRPLGRVMDEGVAA